MAKYDDIGTPINADEERTRDSVIAELIVSGYVSLTYTEVETLSNDELVILYEAIRLAEANEKWNTRKVELY